MQSVILNLAVAGQPELFKYYVLLLAKVGDRGGMTAGGVSCSLVREGGPAACSQPPLPSHAQSLPSGLLGPQVCAAYVTANWVSGVLLQVYLRRAMQQLYTGLFEHVLFQDSVFYDAISASELAMRCGAWRGVACVRAQHGRAGCQLQRRETDGETDGHPPALPTSPPHLSPRLPNQSMQAWT